MTSTALPASLQAYFARYRLMRTDEVRTIGCTALRESIAPLERLSRSLASTTRTRRTCRPGASVDASATAPGYASAPICTGRIGLRLGCWSFQWGEFRRWCRWAMVSAREAGWEGWWDGRAGWLRGSCSLESAGGSDLVEARPATVSAGMRLGSPPDEEPGLRAARPTRWWRQRLRGLRAA